MIGRTKDAEELFERLLALRNDLGLLSEEYDAIGGRLVGNFPQAFSHVSLVNSACRLTGHDALAIGPEDDVPAPAHRRSHRVAAARHVPAPEAQAAATSPSAAAPATG